MNAARAVQKAIEMAGGGTSNPNTGTGTTGGSTPTNPSATLRGKVINKFLNVRAGAGTSFSKVDELKQGAIVNLLEKVSGFWKIGTGRFVSADYIEVIAQNGAPTPSAGRSGKVTSPYLNVRTGPSTGNAKVGELKQGATVSIFETSSNGWHRIGDKRWVIGTNIQEV